MNRRTSAFSLVELIIVISVLGILAALVIPRFVNATDDARAGAAAMTLTNTRKALQRFGLDHKGVYPSTEKLWESLSSKTNEDGDITPKGTLGPYLLDKPVNPWNQFDTIYEMETPVAVAAKYAEYAAKYGWLYDPKSGQLAIPGFDDTAQKYYGTAP